MRFSNYDFALSFTARIFDRWTDRVTMKWRVSGRGAWPSPRSCGNWMLSTRTVWLRLVFTDNYSEFIWSSISYSHVAKI